MILKNACDIPKSKYEVQGNIGEYFIAQTVELNNEGKPELFLLGIAEINLSTMSRTPVAIVPRPGKELKEEGFFDLHYNLEDDEVYFIVHILADESTKASPTFVFDCYDDAVSFQHFILTFKSNNFFGTYNPLGKADKCIKH